MKFTPLLLSTTLLAAASSPALADAPNVVVSIKPVHSLVAAIMQGVGEPGLIVDGAASPHTYALKPSNAAALQDADLIFWVGHGLEAFLEKPLEALGTGATIVELEDAPGLEKLKFREGGAFEAHDHEGHAHESEGHDHQSEEGGHDHAGEDGHAAESGEAHAHDHAHEGGYDTHLWLDPMNAKAMATAIEAALVKADPDNAATYKANLAALDANIDALDTEIAATLAPVKDKPFVVFHDAYQYFEHRYGVRVIGSITVSPETMPGAERISEIRGKVTELGAACVFAEPQFEPKIVNVVLEGTSAKAGTLDPEAGTLAAGPALYFDMMRGLAASMKDCLSGAN
ncbi:zinc ABC transporter substrate-binding protein ZnuA [Rhizobium sp. TRM96647]|uniref:zinc ABC transporter substrate-binding protein ZnuA n=1 Tax=unclassified Rhizobium TaxID=2613769 RepID=UPI0021E6DE1D|nr:MULTISPECIES: zinc ABC transporter substrate-binding protein ZnuA [unclassified Rhizobium]MCV3737723.1 zinc ABC transporter substrate-binding protein ZnuA [Rhizobium sp. TRM96647]MCV3759547.1 zinc ABC transporter substrate-binding protein ZnuA [Rhizobium sp. TRM96650]